MRRSGQRCVSFRSRIWSHVGVLCAAALHDTIEDHPTELVTLLDGATAGPPLSADRETAVDLLGQAFGADVARIVSAVTNPLGPAGRPEDEQHRTYRAHVAEAIADPQVFLVKLADLVDNAGGLKYLTDPGRRSRLARKYTPLVPVFRAAFDTHRALLPVEPYGLKRIEEHLSDLDRRDLTRPR
jgi:hypothetical protein